LKAIPRIQQPTDQNALIWFCLRFLLYCGFLYFLFNWLPSSWVANPISELTAGLAGFLLRVAGVEASVSGVLVSALGFTVKIIPECTAVFVGILFFSFVVAYPASFRQKAIGLIFGLSFLFVSNLLRVLAIILVGVRYRAFFEYAHVYIGQVIMVLLVLSVSMVWLRSVVLVKLEDKPLDFLVRFIGYSSLLFLVWLFLDQGYVFANLLIIKQLLGLFRLKVGIPDELNLHPHTFNTFNLIVFSSLVMATSAIDRRRKNQSLIIGLCVLCGAHFLFRLHQVLYIDMHLQPAKMPYVALIIFNQWVLPFVLWLLMIRNALFKNQALHICPICGEEKKGIVDHILSKHGESALRNIQEKNPETKIAGGRAKHLDPEAGNLDSIPS